MCLDGCLSDGLLRGFWEGSLIRCIVDGRKNCPIFLKLPEWTGNWLHICAHCPKGKGLSLEAAKELERSDKGKKIWSFSPFDVESQSLSRSTIL